MSDARADILEKVARGLGGNREDRRPAALARLARPPENLIPDRARLSGEALIALFRTQAEYVHATTDRVASPDDAPEAVMRYLAGQNLPSRLRASGDALIGEIDWSRQPTLTLEGGVAGQDDAVGLTVALAGVAETGTLVLTSGPDWPTTLNFVPETNIVLLPASRVRGDYESVWRDLRGEAADGRFMPRTVNWITGPSRTADIEHQLLLGVHGPRRLHIILLGGGDG